MVEYMRKWKYMRYENKFEIFCRDSFLGLFKKGMASFVSESNCVKSDQGAGKDVETC